MTAIVRPMTAEDLDAVTALAAEAAGAPLWTREIYEHAIGHQRSAALVATDADGFAGFAVAALILDVCELESIAVAAQFRRKGIGRTLLSAVIAWATHMQAGRIELEVRAGNSGAIALYERAGFVRDGLRPDYYRNPEEDAVLMSLVLDLPS